MMLNPEARRVARRLADTATVERILARTRWITWPRYMNNNADRLIGAMIDATQITDGGKC
jgi:hypothetical protein